MPTAMVLAIFAVSFVMPPAAHAQDATAAQMSPPVAPDDGWATVTRLATGTKLRIVMVASPKRRGWCTVSSADAAQLTCLRRFGRKPISFRKDDIAAALTPGTGTNDSRDRLLMQIAGAGIVTGAVFLGRKGSAGPIIGAVFLGWAGLSIAGVAAYADGGGPDIPIYRKTGLQLKGIPPLP